MGHAKGYIAAAVTVLFWSFTMIWSKILLAECFTPFSLLITRFTLAWIVLWIIRPKVLAFSGWRNEAPYMLCGLFGVTMYFLAEYHALTFTMASNVGILTSISPIITALIVWALYKEKPSKMFVLGFILALAGVVLVSFNGEYQLEFNAPGLILCLIGATCWALYSVSMRNTGRAPEGKEPPDMLMVTRRTFFWGIVGMLICLPFMGFELNVDALLTPTVLGNLACSVLLASAVGYVTWNIAMKSLGVVKASMFTLGIPALTVFEAAIILGEPITPAAIIGVILIAGGLFVSQYVKGK